MVYAKLLALIFLSFTIIACENKMPEAPFGLRWDMSEKEIEKLSNKDSRIRNLPQHQYAITPPAPDLSEGEYLVRFKDGKIFKIGVFFFDKTERDAEKIIDYYSSLFKLKYGEPEKLPIPPKLHKNCIEKKDCRIKSLKYVKGDLVVTMTLNKREYDNYISIGFTTRKNFEFMLKENQQ